MKKWIKNVWSYIQGWTRYRIYYWKPHLLRKHIRDQIDYRIRVMDKECYNNGSCKICGCQTTAMQMADKTCGKPCYPEMMNKKDWEKYKKGRVVNGWCTLIESVWINDKKKMVELIVKDNVIVYRGYVE